MTRSSREYHAWHDMKRRCNNPNHPEYHNYGGRGIAVCKRWLTFANFLDDMGQRPEGLTLDRRDVNGNYKPSNCRWVTQKEQNNNKRGNVILKYKGISMTVTRWAEQLGKRPVTLHGRLRAGWPVERVLDPTPIPRWEGKVRAALLKRQCADELEGK